MRIATACAGGLFLCLAALGFQGQDSVIQLRVDATAVMLDVIVQDSNGRPLTSLTKSDFQIFEDGQQQELRYFATVETPRSTLLMFDVTGVLETEGPFMVQGMNIFLGNIRSQDRVAVAAFGPDFEMLMNFRSLDQGKSAVVRLPNMRVPTNLYDALNSGMRSLGNEKGRKAIVVLTDGRETLLFSQTRTLGRVRTIAEDKDFQSHARNLRKRGVPLYIIALDTDPRYLPKYDYEYTYLKNPAEYQRTDEYRNGMRTPTIAEDFLIGVRQRLEHLAEVTGGRVIYPRTLEEVAGMYTQISRELGYSYTLGYSPKTAPDDGKLHRIEVRVSREDLKVIQSRDGYGPIK